MKKYHVEEYDTDCECWQVSPWLPGDEPNDFTNRFDAENAARRLSRSTPYRTKTRVVEQ